MTPIRFTIRGEPASHKNGYHIVTRGTRPAIVKSKEALDYERSALRQIPPAARVGLEGPVSISLRLFYTSERPDMDESLILDVLQDRTKLVEALGRKQRVLLQTGVYRNDRQVREKHVYHGIDRKNPRVEVEVVPMQAQQAPLVEVTPRPLARADLEF